MAPARWDRSAGPAPKRPGDHPGAGPGPGAGRALGVRGLGAGVHGPASRGPLDQRTPDDPEHRGGHHQRSGGPWRRDGSGSGRDRPHPGQHHPRGGSLGRGGRAGLSPPGQGGPPAGNPTSSGPTRSSLPGSAGAEAVPGLARAREPGCGLPSRPIAGDRGTGDLEGDGRRPPRAGHRPLDPSRGAGPLGGPPHRRARGQRSRLPGSGAARSAGGVPARRALRGAGDLPPPARPGGTGAPVRPAPARTPPGWGGSGVRHGVGHGRPRRGPPLGRGRPPRAHGTGSFAAPLASSTSRRSCMRGASGRGGPRRREHPWRPGVAEGLRALATGPPGGRRPPGPARGGGR